MNAMCRRRRRRRYCIGDERDKPVLCILTSDAEQSTEQ